MLNCRISPCRAVAPATVTTFSICMCCSLPVGGRESKAALTSVLLVMTFACNVLQTYLLHCKSLLHIGPSLGLDCAASAEAILFKSIFPSLNCTFSLYRRDSANNISAFFCTVEIQVCDRIFARKMTLDLSSPACRILQSSFINHIHGCWFTNKFLSLKKNLYSSYFFLSTLLFSEKDSPCSEWRL